MSPTPSLSPTQPLLVFTTSSLLVWLALAIGCGGGGAPAGGTGSAGSAGTSGGAGTTMPAGRTGTTMPKPGKSGTGGTGAVTIGVPTPGTPGTVFPGGGAQGSAPLAPGCTPASAGECPSANGACATSATANPTGVTMGSICFYGPITTTTTTTSSTPAATIEYLQETAGGQSYYRFRITFDPQFVDNTYGANAIGWVQRGHTFKDLVGSDHAELSLFDGTPALVSMFDIDYITANAASSCSYGALGVSGGEGKMLLGDPKLVLASTSSLDRNLNGCGYCKNAACGGDCTIDSPLTDAKYTPNTAAPNWDFRVVYEVWIDAAVFGGKGFGGASISFVHASPSKASTNTVTVTPKPCGGCPPGTQEYIVSEGRTCMPGCPAGSQDFITSEGARTCTPGTPCPANTASVLTSEGAVCVPVPKDGVCPAGWKLDPSSEGTRCI
jgi:hypothetical protein